MFNVIIFLNPEKIEIENIIFSTEKCIVINSVDLKEMHFFIDKQKDCLYIKKLDSTTIAFFENLLKSTTLTTTSKFQKNASINIPMPNIIVETNCLTKKDFEKIKRKLLFVEITDNSNE